MKDFEEVGNRIKKLRKEKNLSQEELGKKIGVKKATVSQWERGGVASIGALHLLEMSKVLGKSQEFILKGYDSKDLSEIIDDGSQLVIDVYELMKSGLKGIDFDLIRQQVNLIKSNYQYHHAV